MYKVKEIFWTVQGEGFNAGTAAVFVRFAGCNQWSGKDEDRQKGFADCARWCDTDFVRGESLSHRGLTERIASFKGDADLVVFTGGEPSLQLTQELVDDVKAMGFRCAIETNGTGVLPVGCWVTVSPKGGSHWLRIKSGDELKLVYPQLGVMPSAVEGLSFDHFYLQPRDNTRENTVACLDYIRANPRWRLSPQVHKYIGVR
jgi:7-carboxy-7-deazaguanine synthase